MNNPFDDLKKQLSEIQRQISCQQTEKQSEWLDADQAADLLSLKKSTVYKKTMDRELPFYKNGKKLKFKRSELEAYLEAGRSHMNVYSGIKIEK